MDRPRPASSRAVSPTYPACENCPPSVNSAADRAAALSLAGGGSSCSTCSSKAAAVLVPVIMREEPTLLFTERAASLREHSGQIAFPGGRVDPTDASVLDAAGSITALAHRRRA